MAENDVKISAFLEIKDQMSGGVKTAASELEKMGSSADKASASMRNFAAQNTSSTNTAVSGLNKTTAAYTRLSAAREKFTNAGTAEVSSIAQTNAGLTSSIVKGNLLASTLTTLATGALGLGKNFLTSSFQLQNSIESTSLQIASSIKAFDLAPSFASAEKMAISTMKKIRGMAAVLPGEAEDYVTVFSLALPKAIESGMRDLDQIATLTSKYAAVAKLNLVDAQQAGMDMFRILSGQAGADVLMWTRLSAHINMTAEAFNKLPAPERLGMFADAINRAGQGLDSAEKKQAALYGAAVSALREIHEAGISEMMQDVNLVLQDMVAYLQQNKDELIGVVGLMGSMVMAGLKMAIGFAVLLEKTLAALNSIINSVKSAITWISDKIGELKAFISGFLADADDLATRMDNATDSARRYNDELARGRADELKHKRAMQDLEKSVLQNEMSEAERARKSAAREHTKAQEWYADLNRRLAIPEMGASASAVMDKLKGEVSSGKISRAQASEFLATRGMENMQALFESQTKGMEPKKGRKQGARAPKQPKTPHKVENFDFRYSKFNITQEFAEGFDPDRIAVAFASDLGRLGEMKTQAAYSPTFAV